MIWLAVSATPVRAQLSTASVNGTVRDSSGSTIPDATVVLRNVNTAVERTTASNTAGNFYVLNIPPGKYTLTASKTGFATSELAPFDLVVNQTATVDFTLKVGAVQEVVTVSGEAVGVQASTAELGTVINTQSIVDLPLNGRNFTQLLTLTPGVSNINVAQTTGIEPVGQFVQPSVNGQRNRSNFYSMDGINNQNGVWTTYAVPPIVDAIQEFKVQTHNDLAEYGGALGGIVNLVTKSGTNQLHGSLWEFMRNDALDARNPFRTSVTPFKQHMYGASVGGPVVLPKIYNGRNRTFFFAAWQGFRFRTPNDTLYRVPTARNLQGDLSDWPMQIYNPFSTREDPQRPGRFIRDPFPNNQIPANLLDQGMVSYAKAVFPAPNFSGVGDFNARDTTQNRQSQDEYNARIDQTLGSKDQLWFRVSGQIQDLTGSAGISTLASVTEYRARNIGTSWVRTFNPSTVMQVQFGRMLLERPSGSQFRSVPSNLAESVGIDPGLCCRFAGRPDTKIVPIIGIPGFVRAGESSQYLRPSDIWQYKGSLAKIIGSHTIKVGGEWNSSGFDQLTTQGSLDFAARQTADLQNLGQTGSGLASFLLNVPDDAGVRGAHVSTGYGGVMGLFFQDQWKATSRLTVNLGLRYDRTFIPSLGRPDEPTHNMEIGNLDVDRGVYVLQVPVPACEARKAAPCIPTPGGVLPDRVVVSPDKRFWYDDTKNFGPRIGLAYRLTNKTALRAGFGIFYDNWSGVIQVLQNNASNWPAATDFGIHNLNVPTSARPTPTVKSSNLAQFGLGSNLTTGSPLDGTSVRFVDPYMKNPYSMQWNFGIQQELMRNTILTVSYVGSGTRRQEVDPIWNLALTPGPGDWMQRNPFPWFKNVVLMSRSWGRSNYNALQASLDRRFSSGLSYLISYTWSKSIDGNGCSGYFGYAEACNAQNNYNLNAERSVSAFDLTHVLSVSGLYEVPVGVGKKFSTGSRIADHIVGNWQINAILFMSSGRPYHPVVSGDIANVGNWTAYIRPNVVGDPELDNPTTARWFNTSAFAIPANYTFGNAGRNILRSDGVFTLDTSLFREFPLGEGRRLEVRLESFRTTNSPVYSSPNANLSSVNYGKVTGIAVPPRQLQLGAKFVF